MALNSVRAFALLTVAAALLSGCASSQMKARKEQRDKVIQTSKLYCEFVNGELYPDVDVQLNLEMSKRCDVDKNMTITQYKTSNENMGLIYCCGIRNDFKSDAKAEGKKSEAKSEAKPESKKAAPAADSDELAD